MLPYSLWCPTYLDLFKKRQLLLFSNPLFPSFMWFQMPFLDLRNQNKLKKIWILKRWNPFLFSFASPHFTPSPIQFFDFSPSCCWVLILEPAGFAPCIVSPDLLVRCTSDPWRNSAIGHTHTHTLTHQEFKALSLWYPKGHLRSDLLWGLYFVTIIK